MKKILVGASIICCVLSLTNVYASTSIVQNGNTDQHSQSASVVNDLVDSGATNTVVLNNVKETTTSSTTANTQENVISEGTTSEIIEARDKELNSLADYQDKYGSKTYGLTAYVLNKVRIFSIPVCFLGVAISAIYQYVIGMKKLDIRDKGFGFMITTITIFVICQALPLVFAIVVRGWRG